MYTPKRPIVVFVPRKVWMENGRRLALKSTTILVFDWYEEGWLVALNINIGKDDTMIEVRPPIGSGNN